MEDAPSPSRIDGEALETVLERAAAGDAEAFGSIVRRFRDMAVGYAFTILGDYQLAEDAAQEAFLQAFRDLRQLRALPAFPCWFRQIVFKACDRLRRGARLQTVSLEAVATVASAEPDPGETVEAREWEDRVREAVRALPEHERQVVTLFYLAGYSQKEIAAFLEISVTAVKQRLYRARKRLENGEIALLPEDLQRNRPSREDESRRGS